MRLMATSEHDAPNPSATTRGMSLPELHAPSGIRDSQRGDEGDGASVCRNTKFMAAGAAGAMCTPSCLSAPPPPGPADLPTLHPPRRHSPPDAHAQPPSSSAQLS
ncbi:hypothetical protein B2J93_5684 [Marssonina coronariae]|uniref:Uncharacterized protein n=1 Tax=Diplocarpon coronariae TaxID=2795749 RepID=A0A218ZBJ8_9HELO|nr:hypothetical protein B2J93_5684 [Marssonina coronariae]